MERNPCESRNICTQVNSGKMKFVLLLIGFTSALAQNNSHFELSICSVCECIDTEPLFINCASKSLDGKVPDTDWPNQDNKTLPFELSFESNNFQDVLPFPAAAAGMTSLNLRKNEIQAMSTYAFKSLSKLVYLDLSYNLLTQASVFREVFEGQFSDLEYEPMALISLNLGYNQIHSLDKNAFDHLPHVEVLYLNNNPLPVLDYHTVTAITTLRRLRVLNLSQTGLANLPEGFLYPLRSLNTLYLANNNFASVPIELARAIKLERLNLNNNPIKLITTDSFQELGALRELNISSMPFLEAIESYAFSSLKSMETLWLSYNPKLRRISGSAFAKIVDNVEELRFKEFHFRANGVSSLPNNLLPWSSLEVVDIQENPWFCDCRIGWIITSLIPVIEVKSPELVLSLTCAQPQRLKERSLISLQDPSVTNCEDGSTSGWLPIDPFQPTTGSGVNTILIVASCAALLIALTVIAIFTYVLFRRKQFFRGEDQRKVRYFRAELGDDESMDKQSFDQEEVAIMPKDNVYYGEP